MNRILTDDTLRETATHGDPAYPFAYYPENIWQFDFHRISWHWHHELEWLIAAEGAITCLIGDERIELSEGSGIFINSGVLHGYEAQSSAFCPNIVFDPSLLAHEDTLVYNKFVAPVLHAPAAYQLLSPQVDWQNQMLRILWEVFALQEAGGGNELHTVRLLLSLWAILADHMDTSAASPSARRLNHRQAKLQAMMQFIHTHYREDITLSHIAACVPISKSGALHIFQSCIKTSPVAYLTQYRLAQAALQLKTTHKTVAAIAADTGFGDAGYFCRRFRQRYGMSANAYRRRNA